MIQKEQIQQRRQHIAEVRHADSVYRDIVARENEREDYEKRWFWELLQNAKDSVEENQSIQVKIEISENEISFSHTGNPFELDDILSLIIQGSSKNDKEGKTGRFGTGFMTTYLLSKEVYITGKLNDNQGCFHFLLNRDATDNEHFFKLQQESNKEFDESIREESYLGDDKFKTKFTYRLGEKGKATAKVGLQCLDELIPITQLFNEQIESVIVVENGSSKTFSKTLIKTHELGSINEWEIITLIDGSVNTCLKAYIQKDEKFDACIITQETKDSEKIFALTKNYPRLYYTFPLIGTEEIGIPIIVNSTQFDPRVERDGVYLKKVADGGNESNNKEIINKALSNSLQTFAELFKTKKIVGIYELFDFKICKDLKWVDQEWFTTVKSSTINLLASKEIISYHSDDNRFTSLNELIIPFTEKENTTGELWELLSEVKCINVPTSSELLRWVNISESIALLKPEIEKTNDLKFVWGVNELIKFVERKESLTELENFITADKKSWLNNLYSLIIKIKGHFPLDIKICLNQRNRFRVADGIYWDKCNDDELISISDLIELDFSDKLFSREINSLQISGVENYTIQNAVNDLKARLNELNESDFVKSSNQECNARFLKWLILKDHKEIIKDLKVLTGASKKINESFTYDHFPKSEHLLLTPKPYFEINFPLYSGLVRDKDCLNEIYNEYLNEAHYNFLNESGFIHISPLVTKTETATLKLLEHLIIKESDLIVLRDAEGQLKYKFKITYSDFAYLTATDGHIYGRNTTQKSTLERLKFLLSEAVEKDTLFDSDIQKVTIEGLENPIQFRTCLWVYRAKRLNWVNVKTESEGSETKFVSETPSSKNLSEILKGDENLVKAIRGSRQQNFLNKLGVGVSDLIRNTLATDELRLSWDKAITNMITSDADPELVQEIFNDPNIRKEYEKRLNERKLISRNQTIGKLIEDLFKEYIEQLRESGIIINIHREPFGSDYILTEESSDLVNKESQREGFRINNWLIELKATGKEHASMTPLQAKTATEQKNNYSLVVVPLDGTEPDIEYLRINAKVISNIGHKIDTVFKDFSEVEIKKSNLNNGQDGISVSIEDQNIRFRVSSAVWSSKQPDIETFIKKYFKFLAETSNETTTT
ncbi:MAG: sacsin N-terminal ATP-binding-like domain-containing protein [Chitinophagaceae bacterium]